MWLLIWTFLLFTSTFAHFMIAPFDSAENAGNAGNLLFMLCLLFCGVLASPDQFPHFWIFMYRVSPFTYLVSGMLAVGVANTEVVCAANEFLHFDPPSGSTCGRYMEPFISFAGGYVENESATANCSFCPMRNTENFLQRVNASYGNVWRNFGIMWALSLIHI